MYKTLLIVVLYGKTYKNSQTLNCLMIDGYSQADLLIVNRGPKALEFDKDFIHTLGFFVNSIDIREYSGESSLGDVYNRIIKEKVEFDRFIFIDDDSTLSKGYIKKLNKYQDGDVDLQMPNIVAEKDGRVHYPVIDQTVRKFNDGVKVNQQNSFKSIGIGLVVYRSLVDKLSSINVDVFDRDFTHYGVNNGLTERVRLLKMRAISTTIQIVGVLKHSMENTYSL
ncbi:hypothetical protein [Pantoea cypripedii]|uniref:Glycosyltransferase 2-like domain-containing protein n=1 Tax=Pantoea cypripedii TaxID=55209 RepID=A0A6B9GAA4_PANCY|nr:hypothetical protein [Pantoea cypripedii]QGY32300.1 hypothetical protein CUN67_25250 [Pantoea cypripedii]